MAGRGFIAMSEGGPPTPRHKQIVLDLVAPLIAPLGSIAAFDTAERVISLTYDDGPNPVRTPRVLEELAVARCPATFFMLVERAEAEPALARRVVQEGHEVGLHGIDHARLTSMRPGEAKRRTLEGKKRLEDLLGVPVRYFRPPYGAQTRRSFLVARSAGMAVVAWSVWGRDWEEQPPTDIAHRVLSGVAPGGIALLHDSYEPEEGATRAAPTFDPGLALRDLLRGLRAMDYAAVPLWSLMAGCPSVRVLWFHP